MDTIYFVNLGIANILKLCSKKYHGISYMMVKSDKSEIPAAHFPDGLTFPDPEQNFPGEHGSH